MSESHEERLVLPGDLLGTAEEYVPGRGTYEYSGKVYAALLGHPKVDTENKTVSVTALHEVPHLSEGDEVYARIEEIKSAMLVTIVLSSAKNGRVVPGNPEGTVHISKAKESYVEDLNREFAIGDILKAQVIQGYPVVKLSTQGPQYGVVSGRCLDCHGLLTLHDGHQLVCSRCGRKEQRKVSVEYGGRTAPASPPPTESERSHDPEGEHEEGHHRREASHHGHGHDAPPPSDELP